MKTTTLSMLIFATAALVGCEGTVTQSGNGDPLPNVNNGNNANPNNENNLNNENNDVANGPLLASPDGRRLSPLEAETTVQAILVELGVTDQVDAIPLPAPDVRASFSNRADTGNLTYDQVVNLMDWAESFSGRVVADPTTTLGCTPTEAWDACAQDFSERIGRLVWRRPLDDRERAQFEEIFTTVVADADTIPNDGVRAMVEFALMSPDFWYLSTSVAEDGETFDSYATAARLSYFMWGTMPDASLRALADNNELGTAEQIRTQVESMLNDPRAEAVVSRFHREWLHTQAAFDLQKDGTLYPTFNEEMAADFETEFDLFVREIVLQQGAMDEMFSSQFGYVNQRLEGIYGLPSQAAGNDDWIWRDLGETRAGVFTRPLFLASTAGSGESLLIHRGNAIVEQALCWNLEFSDDFLDDAVVIPDDATSGKLLGVENRSSNGRCSGCHDVIDPIGVAFEAFDAIGVDRNQYPDGIAMDTAGTIVVGDAINYSNASDLMNQLSDVSEVRTCYASKWVQWITGFPVNPESTAEVENVVSLGQSATIRDLIVETAASDLFRKRRAIP